MVVTTLGPSHHQAWVQHVTFPFFLLRTPVDMGAPTVDPPPIQGDGGVNRHSIGFQGPGLGALTLDLPTLGIPGRERRQYQRLGRSWGCRASAFGGVGQRTSLETRGRPREGAGSLSLRPRPRAELKML